MKTKFTEGEWFIERYHTMLEISVKGGGCICTVDTDHVMNECMIDPTPEQEANAHLIAAAPDMYKMIETLIGNYQVAASVADHEGYETCYMQDEILAKLLLTKARGE
jgi:hypothetical protein